MRRTASLIHVGLLSLILATACQPSPGTPTLAPTSTPTAAPLPTQTPAPSPTAAPDLRVVDVDPQLMLLPTADMPAEGMWSLIEMGPRRSDAFIPVRGEEGTNTYIERSGWIDTWYAYYGRGDSQAEVPDNMETQVSLYRDASGPLYVLDEGRGPCMAPPGATSLWADMDVASRDISLGDASLACVLLEARSDGVTYAEYDVSVAYRNVLITIYAVGPHDRTILAGLFEVTRLQYLKVTEQPLSDSVTFQP